MSDDVKRYSLNTADQAAWMGSDHEGEYVEFSDYAALQARLDAAHAREDELAEALERAIQHVPKNAISVSEALSKPISKCRTQDFCELALLRHATAKEQRNKQ